MYHIIVNPASRSGRGRKIWTNVIKPALNEKKVPYEAHFSMRPGQVASIAREITEAVSPDEICRIIILGGDGTVNEALQGISDPSRVILSYIPTGSSNDLARDLRIPKKPLDVLEHILASDAGAAAQAKKPQAGTTARAGSAPKAANVRAMDKGIAKAGENSRPFAVSCGIGFDAAVCEEAMHSRLKNLLNRIKLGKLTYLGIAVKQIFTAKKISCDLYLDDNEPIHIKKLLFVAVMNHRYEGGGFQFCPTADDSDGLLDLCVVGSLPRLVVLLALPTAFFGWHYIFPGINHYRAKHVKVKTSSPLWMHTDGEVHERTNTMEVTCVQKEIRFIV